MDSVNEGLFMIHTQGLIDNVKEWEKCKLLITNYWGHCLILSSSLLCH